MTEKQKVLDSVIKTFINKGEKLRSMRGGDFHEHLRRARNSNNYDWAAVELAGLGASGETIDSAVQEYMIGARTAFVLIRNEYLSMAISMAKRGASREVIEDLLKLVLESYPWIRALEELAQLAGRKPTRDEVFALVQRERESMSYMSSDMHERYTAFAEKYLSARDVKRVIGILDEKVKQWESEGAY